MRTEERVQKNEKRKKTLNRKYSSIIDGICINYEESIASFSIIRFTSPSSEVKWRKSLSENQWHSIYLYSFFVHQKKPEKKLKQKTANNLLNEFGNLFLSLWLIRPIYSARAQFKWAYLHGEFGKKIQTRQITLVKFISTNIGFKSSETNFFHIVLCGSK